MVEINNQRVPRYAGVVGGNHNGRQKTRNGGYDVIVGGELFTDYSDHPRKLVNAKSKTSLNTPDATSFFPLVDVTASSLPERLLSEKSGRCGHSRLRSVALYS